MGIAHRKAKLAHDFAFGAQETILSHHAKPPQ